MSVFELYILGVYVALLLYCFSLEFDGFRNYLSQMIDDYIINSNRSSVILKKQHSYSLIVALSIFIAGLSWIGLIISIVFIIDYIFSFK